MNENEKLLAIEKLGFGLMRLPGTRKGEGGKTDINQVKLMVDEFMAAGFTYFDTAFVYDKGGSERAARAALVDRYPRESFQLATKMSAWAVDDAEHSKTQFAKSLERTNAGYFDFYLLHNLGGERIACYDDWGIWDFAQDKKNEGLIKHLGFSFHDNADVLERVIDAHRDYIDFVQLQLNWADWESETVQSRKCYEVARKYNLPIVVMEPIKGGSITHIGDSISAPLRAVDPDASIASWSLRFAASLPGVITVLSGMSSIEQMHQNIQTMKDFQPLSPQEEEAIVAARHQMEKLPIIPCTDCRYCMEGCPERIAIPAVLEALNFFTLYDDGQRAQEHYDWNASEHPASNCIECKQCEQACPQHIKITDYLKTAAERFEHA